MLRISRPEEVKTVFAFPGQGSQYEGMAKYILDNFILARDVFCEAEDVLKIPLRKYCTEKPSHAIHSIGISQPAILATSIAAHRVFADLWPELKSDALIGYSLGTISACVVSSSLTFADALALVSKRANFLVEAFGSGIEFGMMGVICDTQDDLEELIAHISESTGLVIEITGFHAPQSFLLSGHRSALVLLQEEGKHERIAFGNIGELNIPLHSSLLKGLEDQFSPAFDHVQISDPLIPLYGPATNQWLHTSCVVKEELTQQLSAPIQWVKAIETISDTDNKMNFIEFGPNRMLTLFTQLNTKALTCLTFGNSGAEMGKIQRMLQCQQS